MYRDSPRAAGTTHSFSTSMSHSGHPGPSAACLQASCFSSQVSIQRRSSSMLIHSGSSLVESALGRDFSFARGGPWWFPTTLLSSSSADINGIECLVIVLFPVARTWETWFEGVWGEAQERSKVLRSAPSNRPRCIGQRSRGLTNAWLDRLSCLPACKALQKSWNTGL